LIKFPDLNPAAPPRHFPIQYLLLFLAGSIVIGIGATFAQIPFSILVLALVALFLVLVRPRWLVYALAFAIPFQTEIELSQIFGLTLSPETLGGLTLVFLVGIVIFTHKQGFARAVRTPYIAIWLFYLVFSSIAISKGPLVTSPIQGIWAIYRIVWSGPLIYLGVWMLLKKPENLRVLASWLSVGATLGATFAMIQTLSGGRFFSGLGTNFRYLGIFFSYPQNIVADYSGVNLAKLYLANTNIFRGHGTFLASNGFGVLLSATIFVTWGLAWSASRKNKWIWGTMLILQAGGIIATFSRSAWTATLVGMGLLILWNFRALLKKRSVLIGLISSGLLFILVLMVAAALFKDFAAHFLTIFSPIQAANVNWRIMVWEYALQQILEQPVFGFGTSLISNAIAQIPGSGYLERFSTHNMFIDIAYQRGLIALVLFLFFLVLYWRETLKLLKLLIYIPDDYNFILGLFAAGTAFLVSGLGSASMADENLVTLFWVIMAITISWAKYQNKSSEYQPGPPMIASNAPN
jgi:O-antigen ligase